MLLKPLKSPGRCPKCAVGKHDRCSRNSNCDCKNPECVARKELREDLDNLGRQ